MRKPLADLLRRLPGQVPHKDLVGHVNRLCGLYYDKETNRFFGACRANTYSLPEILKAMHTNRWHEQRIGGEWHWVVS